MSHRVTPEAMAQAKRALAAFRSLQPTLNAYARMLTGRADIRVVEDSGNGSTDGKKIYYRPPIELGEIVPHERWNCDKRDERGRRKCPSCRRREGILVTVYHEIAHIWFNSFEETNEGARVQALREAIKEHGGKYAAEIEKAIDAAPWHLKREYMPLASLISDFLPKIINAIEDARVNRELFRALPGTKIMFDADSIEILENGVEQIGKDGEWGLQKWSQYPLNSQIICGLFCKASGYGYESWFHEDVVTALNDEKLSELVARVDVTHAMSESYTLSFPILARLRELGFCRLDTDPEVEEEPEPEPDDPEPQPEPDPESGDDEDSEPNEEPESGPDGGDGEPGDEEQGGESDAEPTPGEADGSEGDADAESEAAGGGGEDQQEDGSEGTPGGESAGEGDDTDERDTSPDSEGDVDDASSEGPPEDGSDSEGPAGGEDRDEGVSDSPGVDSVEDGRDDSGGDDGLAEGLPDPTEGGEADPETAGERSESGRESDAPGELDGSPGSEPGPEPGTDLDSAPDGDDDLGRSERLDPTRGDDSGESPDSHLGGTGGHGEGDDGDDEVIDTGPFTKGTRLIAPEEEEPKKPKEPRPEMGTPEECEVALLKLGDHEPPDEVHGHSHDGDDIEAMSIAIVQGMYFETPSVNILGVQEWDFPEELYDLRPYQVKDLPALRKKTGRGWHYGYAATSSDSYVSYGIDPKEGESFDASESVIGKALLKARVAFADNLRGKHIQGLKAGKVNPRHLGKRAPVGDERLMRKKLKPSKKSYFVLIGIDISGSTMGENISLAKKLAMAEAELLSRLGIKFAVYAHSGSNLADEDNWDDEGLHLMIYNVKKPDESWNEKTRDRLRKLCCDAANLDGHTMEYYRKVLDTRTETDKILHYYSDGAMPAENYDEELEILERELKVIKRKGYHATGIGIRTNAPTQHGLHTIELHEVEDIMKVIVHLEKQLAAG